MSDDSFPPAEKRSKRAWRIPRLRISLRMFLILITVLCLLLGTWVQSSRKQQQAVDAIYAAGGSIRYKQMFTAKTFDDGDRFIPVIITGPSPPYDVHLNVLEKRFPDYFCRVYEVTFRRQTRDDDLRHLAMLRGLRSLRMHRADITDSSLTYLRPLKRLEQLTISASHYHRPAFGPGLAVLRDLPALHYLDLGWCEISPEGIEHLKQCRQLTQLEWYNRTEEQKAEIEAALPETLYYDP